MPAATAKSKTQGRQPHRLIDPDLLPDLPRQRVGRKSRGDRSVPDERGCWRKDIKRVLNYQYGYPLPNDDAGSECFSLLCHAAFARLSPEEIAWSIARTADLWADWITQSDLDALVDEVANRPRKLTKKIIGAELGLTKDTWQHVEAWSLWPIKYTNAEWKRDKAEKARQRAARNYASKRKTLTARDQCIDFLRKVLADEPAPAARILRQAISLELEKQGAKQFGKPMREACRALGVVKPKKGMNGGWWWRLPQAEKRSEMPYISEGDLSDEKNPCFLEGDLSSSPTGKNQVCEELDEVGEAAVAIESAASREGQRPGEGPSPVQGETSARLPPRPAFAPRRDGFGRVPINERWAQPLRAFATASREDRDRAWAFIMAQGEGLAFQAARRRWGGDVSIIQAGGEA
ncbi:MAG TPA: hypothetical protein VFE60_27765 [Roseiarcus sp.]|jgi:hypothetical protein|nr:hypothetical protein [Roseiarcus sp.]